MSTVDDTLVQADDHLILAGNDSTGLQNSWTGGVLTTTESVADWLQERLTNLTKNEEELLFQKSDSNSIQGKVTKLIIDSTTQLAQNIHDFTTSPINSLNFSDPEVTIRRPEVDINESEIGTAEKVVIGAAGIVACMAIVALVLRCIGPHCRSKQSDTLQDEEKTIPEDTVISKLSGFTNLGSDISSNSSGLVNSSSQDCSQSTGSTPVTDWSDFSGDRTKSSSSGSGSSSGESDENMAGRNFHFTKKHNGRFQQPIFTTSASDDRLSARSSPGVRRKVQDEQISVISTQSLEPLRLGQNYRDNWDNQFDPTCSVPRGNLSHLSHPSESRLSLNSISSGSSSTTFPIPSRDIVRQMQKDKERRYPSSTNVSTAKKDKQPRISPTNDSNNK